MITKIYWRPISTMPEDKPYLTRIFDVKGERNVCRLRRQGRLYFAGGMYVYYTPTHWTVEERP